MDDLELQAALSSSQMRAPSLGRVAYSALPPTDCGKDAWLTLAACAILEALVWGKSLPSRNLPRANRPLDALF